MKVRNLLSSFLLFVLVMTTDLVFSQTNEDLKTQIEKLNKEMVQNMLDGNTEKSLSMYADDAISLPSYEPMREGIDEIRESHEKMASLGWKFDSFTPSIVKILPSENLITEIGTYKISMSMPGMEQSMKDQGKYVTIWEKQPDGSLKVKVETWNSDIDPATMVKAMDQQMGIDQR